MRTLAVVVFVLFAGCVEDSPPVDVDAGDGDGGGDDRPDAAIIEFEPIEDRQLPECQPLGEAEMVSLRDIRARTEFFRGCDGTSTDRVPDRAYTWIAPRQGLYEFSLESSEEEPGRVTLGLRRGECVVTELEGAAEPPEGELVCAAWRNTSQYDSRRSHVLAAEAGDVITVIVEAEHRLESYPNEELYQTVSLGIEPFECPWPSELPESLPIETDVFTGFTRSSDFALSCALSEGATQKPLAWIAPEDGAYTFEIESLIARAVAIAVLDGDCLGAELACGPERDGTAATSAVLTEGQSIVLVLSVNASPDEQPANVLLRIRKDS